MNKTQAPITTKIRVNIVNLHSDSRSLQLQRNMSRSCNYARIRRQRLLYGS